MVIRNALVVPIRVDLLTVRADTRTAGPMADFSDLPWQDGRRDVNAGRPYLASEAVPAPFEEDAARLPVGVHLHWALPTALTRGRHRPRGDTPEHAVGVASIDFPRVPNRWLVDAPDGWWVVESDYLHPEGADPGDAVSYLLTAAERERLGSRAPFRFVGRQVPLREWRPHDPGAQYLPGLTAVGWGHPAFHAYHPNCSSVFGFHHDTSDLDAAAAIRSASSAGTAGSRTTRSRRSSRPARTSTGTASPPSWGRSTAGTSSAAATRGPSAWSARVPGSRLRRCWRPGRWSTSCSAPPACRRSRRTWRRSSRCPRTRPPTCPPGR